MILALSVFCYLPLAFFSVIVLTPKLSVEAGERVRERHASPREVPKIRAKDAPSEKFGRFTRPRCPHEKHATQKEFLRKFQASVMTTQHVIYFWFGATKTEHLMRKGGLITYLKL